MTDKITPEDRDFLDKTRPYREALIEQGESEGGSFLKALAIVQALDPLPDDPIEAIEAYRAWGEKRTLEYLANFLFRVWDKEKERHADHGETLVELCNEEWAASLQRHDMEGWLIDQEGCLTLADECGGWVSPPEGRFEVRWQR